MEQKYLREEIKKIKLDNKLSEQQKKIKIQKLMNPNQIKIIKECNHYIKKCDNFVFNKCNNIYNCHRCHLEECKFDNCEIKNISCSECKYIQSSSNQCINCKINFADNYCSICNIWSSKNMFHCNKCCICRAGLKDEIFHCDTCDTCFYTNNKNNHECLNLDFRNNKCPICMESIFNSQFSAIKTKCNHLIHNNCFEKAIANNIYQCMICKKSMIDMTEYWNILKNNIVAQPLPCELIPIHINQIVDSKYGKFLIKYINNNMITGELIDWQFNKNVIATINKNDLILTYITSLHCNDCNMESENNFHFLGVECKYCNSYNTN